MGMSRVYLGAHTLNEVVFGTAIGTTMAAICHSKVKPLFLRLPEMLYSREEEEKYDISIWTYTIAFFSTFVIPMGIASLTLFLRYEDNESALYTSKEWMKRMENSGCKADTIDPAIILHYRHFEHSAIIAVATGAIFGQLFEHQFLANRGKMNSS